MQFLQGLLGQQQAQTRAPLSPNTQMIYPSGTSAADYPNLDASGAPVSRPSPYYGPQNQYGTGFYPPDPNRPWGSILDIAKAIPARAAADLIQLPTGVLEYILGRAAQPGAAVGASNIDAATHLANLFNTEAGRSGLVNVPQVSRLAGIEQPEETGLPMRAYTPEEQLKIAQGVSTMDILRNRLAGGSGVPGTEGFGPTGYTVDDQGRVKTTFGPGEIKTLPRGTLPAEEPAAAPAARPPAAPGEVTLPAPSPTSPLPPTPVRRIAPPGPPPPQPAGVSEARRQDLQQRVDAGYITQQQMDDQLRTEAAPGGAPGAAPGAPGAPGAGAPGAPPVRRVAPGAAPPRRLGAPAGPSPAAVPQADLDNAHKLLGTTPAAPPPGAPPPEGVVPGQVAGGPPAVGARGPRTIKRGQTTYVEEAKPYSADGAVLQSMRTDPKIDALVRQAGGDPDVALQDPTVGPQLQKEVVAEKQSRQIAAQTETKGLESDVVVKRWLAAAKTARTAANELYGPVTGPSGKPEINEETGQPYTFADVLTKRPGLSMLGAHTPFGPQNYVEYLSKDEASPYGLRQAARRVLAGPTIRSKLAKAGGEVGNLSAMEQQVFDSMIVTPSDTVAEGNDKRDLLFRLLDQQIALLQAGKIDPLAAANRFRQQLGLPPRDRIATPKELAEEDRANRAGGIQPGEVPPLVEPTAPVE